MFIITRLIQEYTWELKEKCSIRLIIPGPVKKLYVRLRYSRNLNNERRKLMADCSEFIILVGDGNPYGGEGIIIMDKLFLYMKKSI